MKRQGWLAEVRSGAIGRNVVALGWTSFFTDISSEMVSAALPAYVVGYLGLGPLEFGAVDGIQRGAALVIGAVVAFWADRFGHRKRAAFAGYALSAACKLGLALAGTVASTLGALVLVDRTGKGLRTPARDALIAGSSEPRVLATAFGVHRALDTAGALLGPLVAFMVLMLAPGAFDALFVVSLCFAIIGLATLTLFVDESRTRAVAGARPDTRAAFGLLVDPRFRPVVVVAAALSLVTISEGFLYLVLQQRNHMDSERITLLFVGTASVEVVLTLFAARLADRIGRGRVFLAGHALLLAAYVVVMSPAMGSAQPILCVVCLGAFLAATDGVLAAMASARLPRELAASGLAIVGAATGASKLVASLAFGALWARVGPQVAVVTFCAGVVVGLPLCVLALRTSRATDIEPADREEHAPTP